MPPRGGTARRPFSINEPPLSPARGTYLYPAHGHAKLAAASIPCATCAGGLSAYPGGPGRLNGSGNRGDGRGLRDCWVPGHNAAMTVLCAQVAHGHEACPEPPTPPSHSRQRKSLGPALLFISTDTPPRAGGRQATGTARRHVRGPASLCDRQHGPLRRRSQGPHLVQLHETYNTITSIVL